jgi:hypothetical protein
MEMHNQEQIRNELIKLTEKQINILEKQMFGGVTDAERREYEQRQARNRDLFIELHHLAPAA